MTTLCSFDNVEEIKFEESKSFGVCLTIGIWHARFGDWIWKTELTRSYDPQGDTDWKARFFYVDGKSQSFSLPRETFYKLKELLESDKVPKISTHQRDYTRVENFYFYHRFLKGKSRGVKVYHLEDPYDVDKNFSKNMYPPYDCVSAPTLDFNEEYDMWCLDFQTADFGGYDVQDLQLYFETEEDVLKFLKGEEQLK